MYTTEEFDTTLNKSQTNHIKKALLQKIQNQGFAVIKTKTSGQNPKILQFPIYIKSSDLRNCSIKMRQNKLKKLHVNKLPYPPIQVIH